MTIKIKVEKEVNVKTLHVKAGVRYWGDSTVNGQEDTEEGDNIPCKDGDYWKPIIDLETGQILNWKQGTTANLHYKVCDNGCYYIIDEAGNTVLFYEYDYVPDMLCPKEEGYGDYIIMDIDENGFIKDWKSNLSDFL